MIENPNNLTPKNSEVFNPRINGMHIIDFSKVDWKFLSEVFVDTEQAGIAHNVETFNMDYDKISLEKIKTFRTVEVWGIKNVPLVEIAEYVHQNFSDKYHIPDTSYFRYLKAHPEKIPSILGSGDYKFLFGTVVRIKGKWSVPYILTKNGSVEINYASLGYNFTTVEAVLIQR